jgi:anti-anti-sigma regulatory factor
MSTATTTQAHIAYELIENTEHQVVIVEFLSHDIATTAHARELGEQLHLLICPDSIQYFVIDCAGVRSLGSTAFSEILSFVRDAKAVWVCNLDNQLRFGAALIGLDTWAKYAANRRAAIEEAERTARWREEDALGKPAGTL